MTTIKLTSATFETKLGTMIAIANDQALYFLNFVDAKDTSKQIEQLKQHAKAEIVSGITQPIKSIQNELNQYFEGTLTTFKTPLALRGSPFQKNVWEKLQIIPFGKTISYATLAVSAGNPAACRAVAQANGRNRFAIIIPCHRVINASGKLGGYNGGLARKEWLLNHEKMQTQ